MKDLEKKIRHRIERVEAMSDKPGLFRKLLKQLPEGLTVIRSELLKTRRGHMDWEVVFGKDGKVAEKALFFGFGEDGIIGLRYFVSSGRHQVETDLLQPRRKFGKFLHKFGLTRRLPKGSNQLSEKEYIKAHERLIESFIELQQA